MTVSVNHNYPSVGSLRAVQDNGEPQEGAIIRLFRHTEYLYNPEAAVHFAQTTTNSNGEWENSVSLEDGQTWVVKIYASDFGPKVIEITT